VVLVHEPIVWDWVSAGRGFFCWPLEVEMGNSLLAFPMTGLYAAHAGEDSAEEVVAQSEQHRVGGLSRPACGTAAGYWI
jgi:hypothetical protein